MRVIYLILTVGRKNWLFADTPKGAKASAAVYSLVETAKANGLNVYAYLQHLLMYMPDTHEQCIVMLGAPALLTV